MTTLVAKCRMAHKRSKMNVMIHTATLAAPTAIQPVAAGAKAFNTDNAITMKRYVISRMGMASVR